MRMTCCKHGGGVCVSGSLSPRGIFHLLIRCQLWKSGAVTYLHRLRKALPPTQPPSLPLPAAVSFLVSPSLSWKAGLESDKAYGENIL